MRKEWLYKLLRKRFVIIILLIVQLWFFFWLLNRSLNGTDPIIWEGLFSLISIGVAFYVAVKRGKEAYKISWILQILIFPIYGGLFYLLFNRQTRTKRFNRKIETVIAHQQSYLLDKSKNVEEAQKMNPEYAPLIYYLHENQHFPVYSNTECSYYKIGEDYFEGILEAIKKAEHYIFLEFFIVQEGVMWNSILEILEEKANQGVDVRVMYDDIGCFLTLPKDYDKRLEEKGIKCKIYNPFHPILTTTQNNRDHRKIVAVDGTTAFTGGINIADEYINAYEKHGHWKDTGVKLEGEGAWGLTLIFLQLWCAMADILEDQEIENLLPEFSAAEPDPADGFVQPYADSPIDDEHVGENVYIQMIQQAKKYVYINTPYLILDDNLQTALDLAAKSGIEIKIITPEIWDKRLVHLTTQSYYRELMAAGVHIYEYKAGFNHAKSVLVDDQLAFIGTTNLDYRSLYLHFECGVCLYRNKELIKMKEDFLETLEKSREITLAESKRTFWVRLGQDVLRIFAPLM